MAGGEGVGVGAANSAAVCPVCGYNQPNLMQHLSRHSKEEIIRAVTQDNNQQAPPAEVTANRRPIGRPRRQSFPMPAVASVALISPRPTTSQTSVILAGNQAHNAPIANSVGPVTPSVPQPPPVQTVRLGQLASVVPPPRNGPVPLTTSPIQHGTPGNSYLLIGNNMFPAGNMMPNNLQLWNNGVSYLIPSSGGLMLAASPPANQTLLVQTPTSTAQTMPVKHPPPVSACVPVTSNVVAGVPNIPRRPPPAPRTVMPEPVFLVEEPESTQDDPMSGDNSFTEDPIADPIDDSNKNSYTQDPISDPIDHSKTVFRAKEELPAPTAPTSQDQSNPKTTIHIGKNISISLPKDLVGKKDRLKEIINQVLVRALLMNDNQENGNVENQPSTSTGKRKGIEIINTKNGSSGFELKDEVCTPSTIVKENDLDMTVEEMPLLESDEESVRHISHEPHQYVNRKLRQDVDPLGNLVLPSSSRCRTTTSFQDSSIHIDPNVPSPAHNITIENGLDDNFNHQGNGSPYSIPGDEPMQVIFEDREQSNPLSTGANTLASSNYRGVELCSRNNNGSFEQDGSELSGVASASDETKVELRCAESKGRNSEDPMEVCNSSTLSNTSQSSGSGNQARHVTRNEEQDGVMCVVEDQQLNFLTSDRSFNTLLGYSAFEEQVLGAVEEVFAGETSSGMSAAIGSTNTNEATDHKQVKKESLRNCYSSEQCSSAASEDDQREKIDNFRCKNEPQPGSSQNSTIVVRKGSSYQLSTSVEPHPIVHSMAHPIGGKGEPTTDEQEEELVDDPSLVEDFTNESIFQDDQMFEHELSNQQTEEVMSLKASETLADSDSERATPHEELQDFMFYDRSCMFAGEPGPANLSPRAYPSMDSSGFHHLTPALITHLDHAVQIDSGQTNSINGLVGEPNDEGVIELTSSETTMHLTNDDCVSVIPSDGMSITQLFPSSQHQDTQVASSSSSMMMSHSSSIMTTSTSAQATYTELGEDSKFQSKVFIVESKVTNMSRQLSPLPSTSGLQGASNIEITKEDEEYDFEYESDCYGDSDSDSGITNRGPLDLDHWKCGVCNKMFKSLKEKLLHAGQHSPCAEAMERSGAIRRANHSKADTGLKNQIEEDPAIAMLQCKEELGLLQEETRAMLESCASNGEYKCPECSLGFLSAEALLAHRKMVFKSRVTCQICHMMFKKRLTKIKHMKTHTLSDLKCLICNRTYPNRYSWSQHQLYHMGLVLFECKECGRRFQRKSELEVHTRTHTGERPFQCVSCSNAFTTRQALKRHLVTHMDGQEVECDVCRKMYKNIVCLNKHKLKAHPKGKGKNKVRRDFMCKTCNEVFPSERKLAWHQETHERWPKKCQQCGECFIHQSSLTKHIRQKHDPHHQTEDGKSENNATCHVCCKVFKKSSLALHLRTHTGVKPFKCDICNRSFAVKCNLEAHKWVHMGVRDRPHKCKMCERSFHRKKDLEAHIRSHKNIRPFTCNECGKSFIHKNNLQLHVREHSGEKQHKCVYCGKAFFRKYNLDNHVRIHTRETPYECTICHKVFTQKSNYNVHMKAFHVERHSVHEEV